jgi:membrane fusion protein, multidrug efflux system
MRPDPKSRPARPPTHTLLRTAAVVALPLALAACRGGVAQEPAGAAQEPVPVRTADVAYETLARPIVATGTFGPKEQVALSFKIGGVVARVLVDEGALVRAGQTLAALELSEIDAALAKARSGAEKAERDLERLERLYADSVVTLSQLEDAETAAQVARADLQAAKFNRRHAVITAPADGVILRRSAEPGENVPNGAPVLTLGSRARGGVVRVGLADRDVVRVRTGAAATATFDALPGRTLVGRVTEIGASAEPSTGTYAVEITLDGAHELPAGLVGRVTVTPTGEAETAVLPVEAVLEADGQRAVVYALSDDGRRAERRSVTVALLDGDRIAVTEGLEGVERIVTDGAAWLQDGAAVRVVP